MEAHVVKKDEVKKQPKADSYHFFEKKNKLSKQKDQLYSSFVDDTPLK